MALTRLHTDYTENFIFDADGLGGRAELLNALQYGNNDANVALRGMTPQNYIDASNNYIKQIENATLNNSQTDAAKQDETEHPKIASSKTLN